MRPTRRRFLAIAGALTATGAFAAPRTTWQGRALGADTSISLDGSGPAAQAALTAARDTIARMEDLFSLYDPTSALSRLNRTGALTMPPEFTRLMRLAASVNAMTDGLFDPTVQPLFQAYREHGGRPPDTILEELTAVLGWEKVLVEGDRIQLPVKGMALTLNGIAQGFATDRVAETLAAHGFTHTLVNIGEYRAGTAPANIAVANRHGDILETLTLQANAVATSAPDAYRFADGSGHILDASGTGVEAPWQTISVVADTAALADGLSTALALTSDTRTARELLASRKAKRILLEDRKGNLLRLS